MSCLSGKEYWRWYHEQQTCSLRYLRYFGKCGMTGMILELIEMKEVDG